MEINKTEEFEETSPEDESEFLCMDAYDDGVYAGVVESILGLLAIIADDTNIERMLSNLDDVKDYMDTVADFVQEEQQS